MDGVASDGWILDGPVLDGREDGKSELVQGGLPRVGKSATWTGLSTSRCACFSLSTMMIIVFPTISTWNVLSSLWKILKGLL